MKICVPYHQVRSSYAPAAIECIVMTSREQRLITKEHIATHTNLFVWFIPRVFLFTIIEYNST